MAREREIHKIDNFLIRLGWIVLVFAGIGTANALRSDLVSSAIDMAPGGVAIAIIQWSSISRQALGIDWVILRDKKDVDLYADAVDAMPRRLPGGGTMIHSGLEYASRVLESAPGGCRDPRPGA